MCPMMKITIFMQIYPVLKKVGFDTLNPKPLRMKTRDVHISKGCVIKSEVDDDWRELVSTNIGPPQTCTPAILSLSGACESVSNLIKTKSQKYPNNIYISLWIMIYTSLWWSLKWKQESGL